MNNKPKSLPVLLPSKGGIKYLLRAIYSVTNFVKASIVSIIVLVIILLLLTQMEQAFTMLLRMLEYGKWSLLICFMMINLLAVSLSHYPIYTYYAGNLNGSRKYVKWKKENPFDNRLLKWVWVYTFSPITNSRYVKDIYANILRQSLGLSVFVVWQHFIISTFEPNLMYSFEHVEWLKGGLYGFSILPFIAYAFFKRRLSPLHSTLPQRKRIYKRLGFLYFISFALSVIFMTVVFFNGSLFSTAGLLLLLFTNYAMMFNFIFFRLVRPRLSHVLNNQHAKSRKTSSVFLKWIKPLEKSSNYIVVFQFSFYFSILSAIYFTLASLNDWLLPNGIAIVMIFLYIYFFIIGSIGKYYFVHYSMAKSEKDETGVPGLLNRKTFRYLTTGLTLLVLMFFIGQSTESTLNELDIYAVNEEHDGLPLTAFERRIERMSDTVFFVSSHGGGLKANTWTLMVMDELQSASKGEIMHQTIAMSGASGGSLGLALYGNIHGLHGKDPARVKSIINAIQKDNYASIDISMLFGLDMSRVFYPFNQIPSSRDRAYYGMLKYQNHVRQKQSSELDQVSYRRYWQSLQRKGNYLPALIMNTASTNGKRGIFCSLNTEAFDTIFPYAENLASLRDKHGNTASVPFYQAVSTTNRFPIFSPVAKIKGAGHFIDAGAIDNSGILGCWDMFLYLREKDKLEGKTIVFIDIENGKSGYVQHVLDQFETLHPNLYLKKDEFEKSSIVANLQTGLNLDKIPGYLNKFMSNYSAKHDGINYNRIFLPHKVSISDIEGLIDGSIEDKSYRILLKEFLDVHNAKILEDTEVEYGFWKQWESYEPVLSRQLSRSNINYFNKILGSELTCIDKLDYFFN